MLMLISLSLSFIDRAINENSQSVLKWIDVHIQLFLYEDKAHEMKKGGRITFNVDRFYADS